MESFLEVIQEFWIELQQGQLPMLGAWTYVLLAFLTFWQGPTAMLLGGAAASAGLLNPVLVFFVGVFTNLSADTLWYTIGKSGNFERVFEWRRMQRHKRHYEALRVGMEAHASKIILMAKLSLGLVIPTLMAAGMVRIKWRKWFPYVFIGETIWTGALVLIGYYATEAIKQVEEGLQLGLLAVTLSVLVVLLWYIPRSLREKNPVGLSSIDENNHS